MANKITSSSEFASLVSQLHQSPQNHSLKAMVMSYFPYIKELAKTSPLAKFHLAFSFHPDSAQFRETVLEAANLGCTNAMLRACELLIATKQPGDRELALHYRLQIQNSSDTYIKVCCDKLFADNKTLHAGHAHGFFTRPSEPVGVGFEPEEQLNYQP